MARIAKRLAIAMIVLYFAIAAYGCHYRRQQEEARDYFCPCDECDCGPPATAPQPENDDA